MSEERKYNTENLTSLADLPEEKRKEIAAAGGRASQAAQKRKKDLREACLALLEQEMTAKDGTKMSGAEAITAKLFKKALDGDIKAFEVIRDTSGQKPVEKVMVADVDQNVIDEVENIVVGIRPVKQKTGAIVATDKDTNEATTYATVTDAAEALNIDPSNIIKALKGKIKSAGGYKWNYEE